MGAYAKAVVALLTALQTWGATALADGHVSPEEWFGLITVAVAAVGVWAFPNTPTRSVRGSGGK